MPAVLSRFVQAFALDRPQLDLIKRTVCPPGTTDDQMALFFHECRRRGVHPLDRAVIMTLFSDNEDDSPTGGGKKVVFIQTIDYMRSQAEETGEYAGSALPAFGPLVNTDNCRHPEWASVVVYRIVKGRRRPFSGYAEWAEFYPGQKRGHKWRKSPKTMIAKCAEAQGLRKGFPKKLGRLYAFEEVARGVTDVPAAAAEEVVLPSEHERPRKRGKKEAPAAAPVVDVEVAEQRGFVVDAIEEGMGKKSHQPLWQITCTGPDDARRVVYTRTRAFADTLKGFREARRVFDMTWKREGTVDVVDTIDPL